MGLYVHTRLLNIDIKLIGIGIIITDPPLRQVTMNQTSTHFVSVRPFQGGYLDFIPNNSQLRVRAGPPPSSMLEDICLYLKHHSNLLNLDNSDCVALFLTKIIASHYLKQMEYLRAIISNIEWHLTRKDNVVFAIETAEARWSDIQSLECRTSDYCEALESIMIQLRIPFEEPDMQKIQTWCDIARDFQFRYLRFSDIRRRTATLNSAMTGLPGMAGNRQSLKEARIAKTLTLLGLCLFHLHTVHPSLVYRSRMGLVMRGSACILLFQCRL